MTKSSPAAVVHVVPPQDRKVIRDMIYAWLYITVGQLSTYGPGDDPGELATRVIGDLQGLNPSGKPHVSIPSGAPLEQDINSWLTSIQGNQLAYSVVGNDMQTSGAVTILNKPWTGGSTHPTLEELDSIFP